MSELISLKIVNRMIRTNIIDIAQREEYLYSVQLLIEGITGYLLIGVTAAAMGIFVRTLMFMAAYATVRRYAGGYHCRTYTGCTILSLIVTILSVTVVAQIMEKHILLSIIILLISAGYLIVVGAVNNPDMNWTREEYHKMKLLSAKTVCIWLGILAVLAVVGVPFRISVHFMVGIINATITVMIAKISKQEVKYNEECSRKEGS